MVPANDGAPGEHHPVDTAVAVAPVHPGSALLRRQAEIHMTAATSVRSQTEASDAENGEGSGGRELTGEAAPPPSGSLPRSASPASAAAAGSRADAATSPRRETFGGVAPPGSRGGSPQRAAGAARAASWEGERSPPALSGFTSQPPSAGFGLPYGLPAAGLDETAPAGAMPESSRALGYPSGPLPISVRVCVDSWLHLPLGEHTAESYGGLFVSYQWGAHGPLVCTPLVAPVANRPGEASARWFHCKHLPFFRLSADGSGQEAIEILELQVRNL